MDDTLWVASLQQKLSQILSTAESFFNMANIQINPSKSLLTTNNISTGYTPIIYNNHPLNLHPSNEPFKFLGCWFTLNNKQIKQTKLITAESSHLIKIASTKQITDIQARYIINTVIIPTIEYRLHNIVLSQNTCNKILTSHIGLVKNKAKLNRTIPTSTLLYPQLYNIRNIWDIQLQHHITNFTKRLNSPDLLGTSTRIRLQQLQNNLWSPTSILIHDNPIIDGPNKHTVNFKIIQLFKHLGVMFTSNPLYNIPCTIQEGSISLESLLSSHSKYTTFKKQLRHHGILYLDQLTTFDNSCLLDWKHISPRINKIPKGKQPLWFTYLEDQVTSHSYNRTLYQNLHLPNTNYYSYTTGHFSSRKKPWLITVLDNQIIIGKARRQPSPSGTVLITHWQCHIESQFTRLYPLSPTQSNACSGCCLNSHTIANKCTIIIPINVSTKFYGRVNTHNKTLNFNANHLDLIYSIGIRHPIQTSNSSNITITTYSIPNIFEHSSLTNNLQQIANYNSNLSELHFYTDGSVINLGTSQCSMGIGWVQVSNDSVLHTFQAQTKYWPCSFKSELTAILSALITAPRNCTINIYTDSQSVISKYNSLSNSTTTIPYTHTPYFSLWNTLINFIKSYNIHIIFHKVTAHQDNKYNNLADQLARNHYNLPYLIFTSYNTYNLAYTLTFENFPLELPTRRSIRTICHAHIYALWITQNRFQKWHKILNQVNWQATWLYINNNQKISNFSHSFQSSTLKSFRIKILSDELPAPHILHKRYPLCPPTCHQCHQTSSHLHWTTCPSNQLLLSLIDTSLQHTFNSNTLDTTPNIITNLYHQIKLLHSMSIHNRSDVPSIFSTLTGLIPNELIDTIANLSSKKVATTLSIKFLLHLNQQIYHKIWIPYCISRSIAQPSNFNSLSNPVPSVSHILPFNSIRSKINSWYIQWIKYQTNPLYIITNTQI